MLSKQLYPLEDMMKTLEEKYQTQFSSSLRLFVTLPKHSKALYPKSPLASVQIGYLSLEVVNSFIVLTPLTMSWNRGDIRKLET